MVTCGRLPTVDLVVRNFGGGIAKDITFDFSVPIEDSSGFVLSELPWFVEGINFLTVRERRSLAPGTIASTSHRPFGREGTTGASW